MTDQADIQDGRSLIAALGTRAVADGLGEAHSTVSNWLRRDVPRAKRRAVADLAISRGVPVPDGFVPAPKPLRPALKGQLQ